MKRIATILAVIIAASTVNALEIDLGSVYIKQAIVPKVQEYLETKAEYRIDVEVINTTATNELGEVEIVSTTTKRTRVEIPEGDVARLRRVIIAEGWPAIKAQYATYFDDKARAAIVATEDPEESE